MGCLSARARHASPLPSSVRFLCPPMWQLGWLELPVLSGSSVLPLHLIFLSHLEPPEDRNCELVVVLVILALLVVVSCVYYVHRGLS